MDKISISTNLLYTYYKNIGDIVIEYLLSKVPSADSKINVKDILHFSSNPSQSDFTLLLHSVIKSHPTLPSSLPSDIATLLQTSNQDSSSTLHTKLSAITLKNGYINISLSPSIFISILNSFSSSNLFSSSHFKSSILPLSDIPSSQNLPHTMIEFSQPNTCKLFHVGHLRNVALGDSITKIHKELGYKVTPVNYYGDEGAHINKCLWLLNARIIKNDLKNLQKITENKLEVLGDLYSTACRLLSLNSLTSLPFPNFKFQKIISISINKEVKTAFNITIKYKINTELKETPTFILKEDYNKISELIKQDSYYIAIKQTETNREEYLSLNAFNPSLYNKSQYKKYIKIFEPSFSPNLSTPTFPANSITSSPPLTLNKANKIESNLLLTEFGAYSLIEIINEEENISIKTTEIINNRKKQVLNVGNLLLNENNAFYTELWETTKKWSISEFNKIYNWLSVKFDAIFTEHEVSASSKEIVLENYKKGLFEKVNGAIGVPLKAGYAILLKSDETTLYLTKDLNLAERKFKEFKIDKSVYIVDNSQSQHFAQLFEILNLISESIGLSKEKVSQCKFVGYGMVVLEDGKMSSRLNNTITFDDLKKLLDKEITSKLRKRENEEIDEKEIVKRVSIATIKYGMLNMEKEKNIVFNLKKWANFQGNTGPYILYTYARIQNIKKVLGIEGKVEIKEIKGELKDKEIEVLRKVCKYWSIVNAACRKYEPSLICKGLFEICQGFSSWYSNKENKVKDEQDEERKKVMVMFVEIVGEYIKSGLGLLGIETLDRM